MATVQQRIASGNEYVLRHIYALEDATMRQLRREYLTAFRRMRRELDEIWGNLVSGNSWGGQVPTHIKAREVLLQQIIRQMAVLDQSVQSTLIEALLDGFRGGMYGNAWSLDNSLFNEVLSGNARMPLLPTEAIRAQLLAPYEGMTFLERFRDNRADFTLRVKRALIQSQIEGDGVYQVQKRLAGELGIDISRRTKADKQAHKRDFYKTQMIARTEILRASNLGALAVYEANQDVLRGWEFKTALDDRVCPRCGKLDGNQYAFDDRSDYPPIHPQCRCAVLPVLIDSALMERICGKRVTFAEWAGAKGISRNRYGGVYDFAGRDAPRIGKN